MSGTRDHNEAVAAAAGVLQSSLVGASAAAQKTAHIAYYRAKLAAGRLHGVSNGALAALHSLGVDDSGKAGDT